MRAGRAVSRSVAIACALLALQAAPVHAGPRGPADSGSWRLTGDATLRLEDYEVDGDPTQSPYRFTGFEPYGQLNLSFEKRLSPYRSLRLQFLGLVNDNRYRSPFDDVVVERAAAILEDGEHRLAYRIEAGDSFAYFSQRTVQIPVKGLQVELQSPLGPGRRQSLQVFGGIYRQAWKELDFDGDLTAGVSWLVEQAGTGRLAVSFVDSRRDASAVALERDQQLLSVGGQVFLFDRGLSLEAEAAHIEDKLGGASGSESSDEGWFLQLSNGRPESPWLYRVRFESYGDRYAPTGSPILADRRTLEGHLGYRLASGVELRTRLQQYKDFQESLNPLDNLTVGLGLRGPILGSWGAGLVTNLDFFVQDLEDRASVIDSRAFTLNLDARKSFGGDWTPFVRLFWQDIDDHTLGEADLNVTELTFGSERYVGLGGFSGEVGPSLLLRRQRDGVRDGNDYYPAFYLNLARGPHLLRQDLGWLALDRLNPLGDDVRTFSYNLLYRYRKGSHELGGEAGTALRRPDTAADTDSWRVAASYTYYISARGGGRAAAPLPSVSAGSGPVDLGELAPGQDITAVLTRLERAGIRNPIRLGDRYTFDSFVVSEIPERQQLHLLERDGALARAALVIEPDPGGPASFLDSFERARRVFIERYGAPTNVFEQGAPAADLEAEVNRGGFIRLLEWTRPSGQIRLGIPRRRDGRLTIELQHGPSFPPVTDVRWGILDSRP